MKTAKEIREERGKLAKRINELAEAANTEGREFTSAEQEEWDRVNTEYDSETRQVEIAERSEAVTLDQEAVTTVGAVAGRDDAGGRAVATGPTEEHRALAMQGWMRHQLGEELTDEHRAACEAVGVRPEKKFLDLGLYSTRDLAIPQTEVRVMARNGVANQAEMRALSAITGTGGQFTVREGFMARLERNALAFGGMRQVSEIIRTKGDGDMPWPSVDDTSNKATIVGASTAQSDVDPTFKKHVWRAFKYGSGMVKIPAELLEDSAFNLADIVADMLGERHGRGHNEHFTTGDGAGKPRGLIVDAAAGITAASATDLAADELIDLFHTIDPAYRAMPGFGWMFNDTTLSEIRKLKGSDNNYLWQPGLQAGEPDRLLGALYTVNQDMPDSATGLKPIAVGNLRAYKIRDVSTVRMRRLVERFADTDEEGFILFWRTDGKLLDAGTAPVKRLLMA